MSGRVARGHGVSPCDTQGSGPAGDADRRIGLRALLRRLLPRSQAEVERHREEKRIREAEAFCTEIRRELGSPGGEIRLLEIGCGRGLQSQMLAAIGSNVRIDIKIHPCLRSRAKVVQADVCSIPFRAGQFDVVYSNHVLEHVGDPGRALAEQLRVSRRPCLYLIALPTPLWLLLSVPGQYLHKVKRALSVARGDDTAGPAEGRVQAGTASKRLRRTVRALLPLGHGVERGFLRCFLRFRAAHWRSLFRRHGFEVVRTVPLLLYGPSEWPILPTVEARSAFLCSSRLFVMRPAAT